MRITENAINSILKIMRSKRLDPEKVFFEIKLLPNQAVGIAFTYDKSGILKEFGELKTVTSESIDMTGVVIDYGEADGRKGILFLKE